MKLLYKKNIKYLDKNKILNAIIAKTMIRFVRGDKMHGQIIIYFLYHKIIIYN
jgi:hypothetical protein